MIYIDGKYYKKEDAKISVFDHGLLYGDGLFEGIRVYSENIFLINEHIDRIFEGAQAIALEIPLSKTKLKETLYEAVKKNKIINGYIRLIITRGVGSLGIDPASCAKPSIIIIADTIQLYPKEFYQEGICLVTSSYRRNSNDTFEPKIKSLNYLNNVLAKIEARQAGCFEAIFLNREGFVVECTGDNIFIVKNNTVSTPHPSLGLLGGLTRKFILNLCEKLNISYKEDFITRYDLYNADEVFLTGSAAELIPVKEIDKREIKSKTQSNIYQTLRENFAQEVKKNNPLD